MGSRDKSAPRLSRGMIFLATIGAAILAVIIFIQWKPAGLFPPRGRLADV